MPYIHFIERWTPLKLIGIKIYRDDEGGLWIKIWGFRRRKI